MDELDKVISDLQNYQSSLYLKLLDGIPRILDFKLEQYSKQLEELNKRLVDTEQPRLVNALCASNMKKDTIEYKSTKDGKYKSFDLNESVVIDITTGKVTDIKSDEIPSDAPRGITNLFNSSTQCQGKPRSLTIRANLADEESDPASGVSYPNWQDLQEQNKSYFEQMDKRNKLRGFLSYIQSTKTDLNQRITIRSTNGPSRIGTNLEDRLIQLKDSLKQLRDNIIGESRQDIRNKMAQFVISFANNWRLYTNQYLNIALLGPPGSGKSSLAKYIGQIFKNLGILILGQVSDESRATIVGQYVGQTADKVRKMLVDNLESIVFIDEAYAIAQGSGQEKYDPYGVEAINEIVGFLDKNKGQICIISAGYADEMNKYWFGPNPGLRRRTPYVWTLKNYTSSELFDIMKFATHKEAYSYAILNTGNSTILENNRVGSYIKSILDYYNAKKFFINQAGDMETLVSEIVNQHFLTDKRLSLNDIQDIFQSFLTDRAESTPELSNIKEANIKSQLDSLKQDASRVAIVVAPNAPVPTPVIPSRGNIVLSPSSSAEEEEEESEDKGEIESSSENDSDHQPIQVRKDRRLRRIIPSSPDESSSDRSRSRQKRGKK